MRNLILFIILISINSCARYHKPILYYDRGVPTDFNIPLNKSINSNKYSKDKPYHIDRTYVEIDTSVSF